jgi:hypothetical protein
MNKTKREGKKLSIDMLTVRPLASRLTDEQLRAVGGGQRPETAESECSGCSSGSRAMC